MTLQEYKEKYFDDLAKEAFGQEPPKELFDKEKSLLYDMFKEGFYATIELQLPVKFASWIRTVSTGSIGDEYLCKDLVLAHPESKIYWTEQELYVYWETNILKLE